jgi:hypothetical protein
MYKIQKYIGDKKFTYRERQIINKHIFKNYDNWAIKQAKLFRNRHRYKCIQKNIKLDELIFYSRIGLYKSIEKYNGFSSFTNYSIYYVNGELNQALSDAFALSILPKTFRLKNKSNLTDLEKIRYKKLLYTNSAQIELVANARKYDYNIRPFQDIWCEIGQMNIFDKRVFELKYDFFLNKQLSNKKISILMCCSEEHIRKTIKKCIQSVIKMEDTGLYHFHK